MYIVNYISHIRSKFKSFWAITPNAFSYVLIMNKDKNLFDEWKTKKKNLTYDLKK